MSNKKPKTKEAKITKKHDFSHLTKTKTAAMAVQAETSVTGAVKSPLDKYIRKDLRLTLVTIAIFVVAIVALWLAVGRNGEIFTLAGKIKLFK